MDGLTYGSTDEQMYGHLYGQMNGRMDGQTVGQTILKARS